ncbi:coiled-coil domain-containing protein 158 [Macadamia integrifolia]|uniref:coiled-coil domain-containing protein 158 n=1 Tax=Macadamia integrifolia TaxID=60698 RepID=UPI001C4ECDD9|nr:coiled-coil domain-containing protein 158 [Macadamia integrifolia]
MDVDKGSKISGNSVKSQKIFNALVHMLQTQQIQLESLAKERKVLENRILIQQDRWVSDVHILQQRISQMKMDISQLKLACSLEEAKSDLLAGLKQREAFLYKLKLGRAETDLQDLKLWVDCLTHKCSEQKGGSQGKIKEFEKGKGGGEDDGNTKEEEHRRSKLLEGEVRKLKRAQEKLTSENNSEVSALLAERNFLWNQFKKMESEYDSLLKSKLSEVQQANEKIDKLVTNIEQLESSNCEKDKTILMLRTDLAKLEAAKDHSDTEFSRISKELELLRNSRSASVTPVLNRCMVDPNSSNLQSKITSKDKRRLLVKKEFPGPSTSDLKKESEKGCRKSSKRKSVDSIPSSETPKLFSSTFKVPKLKNPSSIACVT